MVHETDLNHNYKIQIYLLLDFGATLDPFQREEREQREEKELEIL